MELVEVAPCSGPVFKVGIDCGLYKLIGDVHGDLPQVLAHAFQDDAHHTGIEIDVGWMVKEVQGAGTVQLQRRRHTPGLRLRLFQ